MTGARAMLTIGLSRALDPAYPGRAARARRAAGGRGADAGDSRRLAKAPAARCRRRFRTPQFAVLALTFFLCCAAHSGPIFHMVSYAMTCGIPAMAAVSIYSVEGLAGLGGRLLLGVLADRLGVKLVLVAGLLVQAVVIGSYPLVSQLGEFYALAVVFGAAYGGVMPLYAVLAREYFGQRVMGAVFGAATMASSIGMALGPLAGGWVFDRFGVYDWMFIGSAAVGAGRSWSRSRSRRFRPRGESSPRRRERRPQPVTSACIRSQYGARLPLAPMYAPQRRLDREEPAVGEEAVGGGVGAVRAVAEQEGAVGEEVGDRGEVGDAAGVGLVGLVAADALVVVALGVVFLGPFQRLGCHARRGCRGVPGGTAARSARPSSASRTSPNRGRRACGGA